jgi:hypothetical protein
MKNYPTLLIFRQGALLGKIEGYCNIDDKKVFEEKIKKMI